MSSNNSDEVVLELLEKAVSRAEQSLVETQSFRPFAMTLDDESAVTMIQNDIEDTHQSYTAIGERLERDEISHFRFHLW